MTRAAAMPVPEVAMLRLDAIDLKILSVIQREGRITKLALAERVGLSATPCWNRLKRLESAGVVRDYRARLSTAALGPMTTVFMEATLANHRQADFDRFERAVKDLPEVIGCWAVGGGLDYLLLIATRDIDAYQRLVDELLAREIGIQRYFTYVVTKAVKDALELPVERLAASLPPP